MQGAIRLIVICGLPFAGKSMLGDAICTAFQCVHVDVGETKTELLGEGLRDEDLSPEEWTRICAETDRRIVMHLQDGLSVVDTSRNSRLRERERARAVAHRAGADALIILVDTPEALVRERWAQSRATQTRQDVSDSGFEQAIAAMEPPTPEENAVVFHHTDNLKEWLAEHAEQITGTIGNFAVRQVPVNRNRNAYDRWSDMYDADPNPHTAMEEEDVIDIVAAAPGDRILDAACGTGRYCRLFHRRGAQVVGIDFSEGMLRIARRKMPTVAFHCVDLMGILPFPEASFDKVNCAQALKHLPDLTTPLTEFARVVKPSGTITFSVTHPEMDWEGYEMSCRVSFYLAGESDIHHHRFWQYFEAMDRAGLRLSAFRQVPVTDKIRKYLTSESFQRVRGRYQIAIFQATKKESVEPAALPDATQRR